MAGVGGCALGVWGSSGAVSCTLSTPEHGGAIDFVLGCCTPEGRVPGAHHPAQQQVLSGFNPFLRLGQEKGWRRRTESLQKVVGSLPKAVPLPGAVPKGLGAQLQSQRVQPSTSLSPNPVFLGRGVVHVGSQQLGTQKRAGDGSAQISQK